MRSIYVIFNRESSRMSYETPQPEPASHPINRRVVEYYQNLQTPNVYSELIKCVNHVPHEDFVRHLLKAAESFFRVADDATLQNTSLFTSCDEFREAKEKQKSSLWCVNIVKNNFPEQMGKITCEKFDEDFPEKKYVLCVDDAYRKNSNGA